MNLEKFKNLSIHDNESPMRLRNRNVPRLVSKPKESIIQEVNDKEEENTEYLYELSSTYSINKKITIVEYTSSDSESEYETETYQNTYDVNELISSESEDEDDTNVEFKKNDLDITNKNLIVTKTTKGKPLIIFDDNEYVLDKTYKNKLYWRCNYESFSKDKKHCKSRLHTDMNYKPIKQTKTAHNHDSNDPEEIDNLIVTSQIKERAQKTTENPRTIITNALIGLPRSSTHLIATKENLTQQINRIRSRQNGQSKLKPKTRNEIIVPENLSKTYSNSNFVFFDSGQDDDDRIIILATEENIGYLNNSNLWCVDGTFDISPSLFRQLYTINVLVNGRNLPVLYAFLADKTEKIYKRLFQIIKSRVEKDPEYILCDFEKGTLNAIEKIFSKSNISGCWFHLVSNLYKHVQAIGKVNVYTSRTNNQFRVMFKYIKFLAFIPPKDVIYAFNMIKSISPAEFISTLDYFEKFYIGKKVSDDSDKRLVPNFPIKYWNLYNRIIKDLPRTNNNIESWHKSLSQDIESHPTFIKLLKHLRREQRLTEQHFDEIKAGNVFVRKKNEIQKDRIIKEHLQTYKKSELFAFLDKLIIIVDRKKIKQSNDENDNVSDSD